MKEYTNLIYKAVQAVPNHLRDDCIQAGWLGLVKALNAREKKKPSYFRAYAYHCIRNEVLNELATLRGPGTEVMSMSVKDFLLYHKYKSYVGNNLDVTELKINEGKRVVFDRLIMSGRINDTRLEGWDYIEYNV